MSKRQFKSQASSSRVTAAGTLIPGFGSSSTSPFATSSSSLSYLTEPPDLSTISDANTVVAFKSLSKKDGTTKAKALEDLQSLLPTTEVEDGVLEAWIHLYPRTSIDTSRRVRELAHAFHGQVASAAGKKMAKYMSRVVGAWLAGLYDNDKLVVKAAQDSLHRVFPSSEKLQALRKAYQQPLLEFVEDIIENQSSQTLSDERSISPDEAVAKYSRVVVTAIGLLSNLVLESKDEDLDKHRDKYEALFNNKKLWDFALSEDAGVRKSTHNFLKNFVQKWKTPSSSVLDMLSRIYVYKGLESDQTASASDYVESLISLTRKYPAVWTTHYHGKKAAQSRLRHLFKRGSQGSASKYWSAVDTLFQCIPAEVLPTECTEMEDLLKALCKGFTLKEEPRANITLAIKSYVHVAGSLATSLSDPDRFTLLEHTVLPIIQQHVNQDPEQIDWTVPFALSEDLLSQTLDVNGVPLLTAKVLPSMVEKLVLEMEKPLPEQPIDYSNSQNKIASQGERFASLLAGLLQHSESQDIRDAVAEAVFKTLQSALEICKARNGKPYAAAHTSSAILLRCSTFMQDNSTLGQYLDEFATNAIPQLILSPSSKAVISILRTGVDRPAFHEAWSATLRATVDAPNRLEQLSTFTELVRITSSSNHTIPPALKSTVHDYILSCVLAVLHEVESDAQKQTQWNQIAGLLSYPKISSSGYVDDILSTLMGSLSLREQYSTENALEGIDVLIRKAPSTIANYIATSKRNSLLQMLLLLTGSSDDHISHVATELNVYLNDMVDNMTNGTPDGSSMISIIHANLYEAWPDAVSVDILLSHVKVLLKQHGSSIIRHLLPDTSTWTQALQPFLNKVPLPCFAITHKLRGALYLVRGDQADYSPYPSLSVPRDSDGFSIPLRMMQYTTDLLENFVRMNELDKETQSDIFLPLSLTVQLIEDNLSVHGANELWSISNAEIKKEITDLLSRGKTLKNKWLRDLSWRDSKGDLNYKLVRSVFDRWMTNAAHDSSCAYYYAEARTVAVSEIINRNAWHNRYNTNLDTEFQELSKTTDTIRLCDYIIEHTSPLNHSTTVVRFCNQLIADLTGSDITQKRNEVLRQLVLLNTILHRAYRVANTIFEQSKQRLVFFVKKMVVWLKAGNISLAHQAEILNVLSLVLPRISDIYGEQWADVFGYLVHFWQQIFSMEESSVRESLPVIYESIVLFQALRTTREEELKKEIQNDDLLEAWEETEKDAASSLLRLLSLPRNASDDDHKFLKDIDQRISGEFTRLPFEHTTDISDVYALMDSRFESVQGVAYATLHNLIPTQQAQISIDVALDKKQARLPNELLSLIIAAPSPNAFEESAFKNSIPPAVRGYLLSWRLVFDHIENAVRF
jgi:hypothetical protein